jgi:tetratricopeptide (TPR) repeat protein
MSLFKSLARLFGFSASPEKLTRRANRLQAKEEYMAALDVYKKALAADPMYTPAYDGLGRAYYRLGFREESDREFAIAEGLEKLTVNPEEPRLAVRMGQALSDKGLYKLIPHFLEPPLKKYPYNRELLRLLGSSYKALGNHKRGREILTAGIQRFPRDADFYSELAGLEIKHGNKKEGEQLAEIGRAILRIESNPGEAEYYYQLASLMAKRKQYAAAAEQMRSAIQITPRNGEYWLFLGKCYWQAGQRPAAADTLKKAVHLLPTDPRPSALLSKVYQALGRLEEARTMRQVSEVLRAGEDLPASAQAAVKYIKYLLSIGQREQAAKKLKDFQAAWPDDWELKLIEGRLLVKAKEYQAAIPILKEVAAHNKKWAEPHIHLSVAFQRLGDAMSSLAEGQLATRLAPKNPTIHKIFGDILREQKKFSMAENAYETAENLKADQAGNAKRNK